MGVQMFASNRVEMTSITSSIFSSGDSAVNLQVTTNMPQHLDRTHVQHYAINLQSSHTFSSTNLWSSFLFMNW